MEVLGQVKVASITGTSRNFSLFELFADLHGDAGWENGTFNAIDHIEELILVPGLCFRLIKIDAILLLVWVDVFSIFVIFI